MITKRELDRIRAEYPAGTHVKLAEMKGELQMEPGLKGIVTSVDDIGQIHVSWENGSTLALTEEDRFEKVKMLRVVVCRPGEKAEAIEIEDDLEAMQEVVGGLIQEYMPFHSETDPRYDDLALICNEEGKLMGMKPCRAISDEKGQLQDVIAGPFFICYAPVESESFLSLPEDLAEDMRRKYELPEQIFRTEKGVTVVKFDPAAREKEQAR